jgi:hypothetical protein
VPRCSENEEVYLFAVPSTPERGLKGRVPCGSTPKAYCYASTGENYFLEFELENAVPEALLERGMNCASEGVLRPGVCERES